MLTAAHRTVLNLRLALVSTNLETLDGVQDYFKRVGARLTTITQIEDAPQKVEGTDVVVLFADDYPRDLALRVISVLSVKLIIVVTADLRAYPPRAASDGLPRVLVLARPAWGWMLLDAVRVATPRAEGKN